jgi:hypothetical protein
MLLGAAGAIYCARGCLSFSVQTRRIVVVDFMGQVLNPAHTLSLHEEHEMIEIVTKEISMSIAQSTRRITGSCGDRRHKNHSPSTRSHLVMGQIRIFPIKLTPAWAQSQRFLLVPFMIQPRMTTSHTIFRQPIRHLLIASDSSNKKSFGNCSPYSFSHFPRTTLNTMPSA